MRETFQTLDVLGELKAECHIRRAVVNDLKQAATMSPDEVGLLVQEHVWLCMCVCLG